MATLAPSLTVLRNEYNAIAPQRDKKSDGWIGDPAHQERESDHNPDPNGVVHAIDIDVDLNATFTMQQTIDYIVGECRKDNSIGKDRGRLKYIIFNRKSWSAPDWKAKNYHGDNPHTTHAHLSAEYADEYEKDVRPWGLIDKFGAKPMTTVTGFSNEAYGQLVAAATKGVLSYGDANDGVEEGGVPDLPGQAASNVLNIIADLHAQVSALTVAVDELKTLISQPE